MHDGGYAGPSVAGGVLTIVDHDGARDVCRALRMAEWLGDLAHALRRHGQQCLRLRRATPRSTATASTR